MNSRMQNKSVSDLILDKFGEYIKNDDLFKGISVNLISSVRKGHGSSKIKEILEKDQNEDIKS